MPKKLFLNQNILNGLSTNTNIQNQPPIELPASVKDAVAELLTNVPEPEFWHPDWYVAHTPTLNQHLEDADRPHAALARGGGLVV